MTRDKAETIEDYYCEKCPAPEKARTPARSEPVYCLCQQPADADDNMIVCDDCGEWYVPWTLLCAKFKLCCERWVLAAGPDAKAHT